MIQDYEIEVEDNIIKMPDINFEPNQDGIGCELFLRMRNNKLSLAQIDAATGTKESYGCLLEKCIRTAIKMRLRDITSDDVICVVSYNHLNSCVPYIAGLFLTAKVCCLDPSLSDDDSQYLLSIVRPKIIFVVPEKAEVFNDILSSLNIDCDVVVFGAGGKNSFDRFLAERKDERHFIPKSVDDINETAMIIFSSGISGPPKGICLSHYVLFAQTKLFQLNGYNTNLIFTSYSLYWISGVILLLHAIMEGTPRLLSKPTSAISIWQYLSAYQVTMMFSSVIVAVDMIKTGRPENVNTDSLVNFLVSGTAVHSQITFELRDLLPGTNVFQVYGLSEFGGIVTTFRPNNERDVIYLHMKPMSCGKPVIGFWYKVHEIPKLVLNIKQVATGC